ncbi:MAG: enoyl-CoA hydratase-related protein, partial [Myxococcota bacterium]
MDYEQIQYRREGAVAWITLNRPEKLNAWTPRMSREQWHAIERANADGEVGAIVMTGAGRGFCAGADISGFAAQQAPTRSASSEDEPLTTPGDWVELCRRSKPLVAKSPAQAAVA